MAADWGGSRATAAAGGRVAVRGSPTEFGEMVASVGVRVGVAAGVRRSFAEQCDSFDGHRTSAIPAPAPAEVLESRD